MIGGPGVAFSTGCNPRREAFNLFAPSSVTCKQQYDHTESPLPGDLAPRGIAHDDDMSDMLSELCILLPGAQMLTTFLIILP